VESDGLFIVITAASFAKVFSFLYVCLWIGMRS
jgi:hypothetical protein